MATINRKQKRWYADSTFESLDKTAIPIGTEIQVSGKLGQADFDDDTNTKLNAINGKLTAPTDEITVDSVPVISSTGTVSAQPFKKYYKHMIGIIDNNNNLDCYIIAISSKSDGYTFDDLETSILYNAPVTFISLLNGTHMGVFVSYLKNVKEIAFYVGGEQSVITLSDNASISDSVIEL